MIDFYSICNALAARFAPGTIATPTGASAMRAAYGQLPKGIPSVPCAFVDVQSGTVVPNMGQWDHRASVDVVFLLSKRPGDPSRVDAQRQRWLPALLAATQGQLKLGLGAQANYEVKSALPTSWEFVEVAVGADEYDAIRVTFEIWIKETVSLTP